MYLLYIARQEKEARQGNQPFKRPLTDMVVGDQLLFPP